ncbi:unnamed protein product [Closterium sp. NIES-53]
MVTRVPDSLRAVTDHFLALDPIDLTVDLLEKHLLAAETSVIATGAARGTPRTPFFEGCSLSPLALSYASADAVDILGAEDVGAASALSGKHRSSKGKGGKSGGRGSGGGGGGGSGGRGGGGGGGSGGSGGGIGGFGGGGGGSGGGGGGSGGDSKSGGGRGDRAGQTCRKFHTQHRCFSRLDIAWCAEFGDEAERHWLELLRSGVDIFALDYDAIFAAMYALFVSAEGDCYLCVPPEPGIEAAALGASESALPSIAPAEALHTFTLDSAPCSCRLLSYQALLWHHRLGHPSLPHLRGMHSRLLVSGLPRSLPPLPPSPAPPCLPCIEGRQHATPHSSSFHPTTAPLQTLHMKDLPVLRLHSDRGGEFSSNLLREFCRGDGILQSFKLPASQQQNGIGERRIGLVMEPRVSLPKTSPTVRWTGKVGDASVFRVWDSRAFVRDASTDKLSPRANPCVFLGFPLDVPGWQFYHPTSHRVLPSQDVNFDESVPFYRLFPYRNAPLPPLPLFLALGPPPVDPLPPQGLAPSGVSQVNPLPLAEPVEVALDSGATRGAAFGGAASGGAGPASAEPGGAESVGVESGGAEPRGTSSAGGPAGASPRRSPRREPLSPQQLREWFAQRTHLRSGAAGAGCSVAGGTRAGGARATSPRGARTSGTGAAGAGGVGGANAGHPSAGGNRDGDPGVGGSCAGDAGAGGIGAGGVGASSPGGPGVIAGAGGTGGAGAASPRGAHTRSNRAAGAGGVGGADVGGAGAGGIRAGDPEAGGAGAGGVGDSSPSVGGTMQRRPFFVPRPSSSLPPPGSFLRQVLSLPSSSGLAPNLLCPPPHQSQPQLQPDSPWPAPSHYDEQTDSLTERREPESRPASPDRVVRTGHPVPRPRPSPVPGTHIMALRPSSVPLQVPLLPPPESSLPAVLDPESDLARAASPTFPRLLATIITDPSFESTAASALVAELVDFTAACRLDYATSLVAEYESDPPPFVGGECALGTDVLEDRKEEFECLAAAVPHLVAMLLAPERDPDAPDTPTPRSYAEVITGTYVNAVPPSRANIVDGMWIFRGVDFFHTFSPNLKMTTLWVLLDVAAQYDYELHSLEFSTTFLQGSLQEEIWLRRPPGFTGLFPAGTKWSLRRPVYGLHEAPREWHDTLRTTLADLGFAPSTADPSLFLRTDTLLPPFYVVVYIDDLVFATADTEALALVLQRFGFRCSSPQSTPLPIGHSLLAPPLDESVELSGQYPELVGCLMYLMTCIRPDLAYPLNILARYVAPGRHRPALGGAKRVLRYLQCIGHGARAWRTGSVSWRSTRSFSVLSSSCEAEIYAGAMAAKELRWLTYMHADLGERPCSSLLLYVDNKAMISLCQEHSLEHRMKHIALCYFLARELQQRGPLRLAYVATRANTADIFTKALQSEAAALGASESAAALGACESAAALGASASTATSPASTEALHTFTLNSGVTRCFFRDCTTVTSLAAPVPVSLADPTGGPVVARASTVLQCLAVPSGSLSGLHLPSFSTNLVSNADLQDVWVDKFVPGGQRVAICTCSLSGRHLATFTQQPGSSLYTLTTASTQVAALGQVAVSSQVSASDQFVASCSCRGPAPSGVSQVDPPPLVEPLEISSYSSGPAEGGDPAADDTSATRRSPNLETPSCFAPWSSSLPPQTVAVDSGATEGGDTGAGASEGVGPGGADTSAEPGGAETGGADSWGAASPNGGGAVGAPTGGPGVGQLQLPSPLETLSPQKILEWIVQRGRPRGGGYGVTASGAAGAEGVGGAAGARVAGATSPGSAAGAGGVGAASPGGSRATGAGGAAGARGDGAGGTRGAAGATGAGGTGSADGTGAASRRPFFYPQLHSSLPPPDLALRQVLSLPSSTSLTPPTCQSNERK